MGHRMKEIMRIHGCSGQTIRDHIETGEALPCKKGEELEGGMWHAAWAAPPPDDTR